MTWARADLRARLLLGAGLLAAALASGLAGLALLLLALAGLLLAARVGRTRLFLLAGLVAVPFAVLNGLLYGSEAVAAWGPLALRREGLEAGLGFAGRAVLAMGLGLWLLGTTVPRDALRLLGRWPRAGLALAATMRFVPMAAEDWARVREAQGLRGHRVARGWRGAAMAAPLVVPLFVATVRRGRALEEAIGASAFGSGPRTREPLPAWAPRDLAVAALGAAMLAFAAWRALRGGGLL